MCWLCRRGASGRLAADLIEEDDEADVAAGDAAVAPPMGTTGEDMGWKGEGSAAPG